MFEGPVGKSFRLGKVSKIHEIFMVELSMCRRNPGKHFLRRKDKLWFGRNDF